MQKKTRSTLFSVLSLTAACSGGKPVKMSGEPVAIAGRASTPFAGNTGTTAGKDVGGSAAGAPGNPPLISAGVGAATSGPTVQQGELAGRDAAEGGTAGDATVTSGTGSAGNQATGRAGSAGSPAPVDGSAHIRGDDPTEQSASVAGPYKVAHYSDGFRDGPDFGAATIYYPTDAEAPFSLIVFCPGYLGTQAGAPPWSDAPWGPFLASHGIVFMLIDTNTPSDSVVQREAALWDALTSLKAENTRTESPLVGKLDDSRVGLMGWSMGGGASWLNAKAHPELKSVVTVAGHNLTAGGSEPDRGITVPMLMFAGTADTSVLGLGMSQPVYEVIPDSTPKMLYEVEGAGHFDFNDPAFNDNATGRYALSWQKVFLEGDTRYRQFLLVKGPKASDFRTNVE